MLPRNPQLQVHHEYAGKSGEKVDTPTNTLSRMAFCSWVFCFAFGRFGWDAARGPSSAGAASSDGPGATSIV